MFTGFPSSTPSFVAEDHVGVFLCWCRVGGCPSRFDTLGPSGVMDVAVARNVGGLWAGEENV